MRTQNPPPLKACRFDSDLGRQSIERLVETDVAWALTPSTDSSNVSRAIDFVNETPFFPPTRRIQHLDGSQIIRFISDDF